MITPILITSFTILGYSYGWIHGYDKQIKDREEVKFFIGEMEKLGIL